MTDHEAKAREITEKFYGLALTPVVTDSLVSAIAKALADEREACAKIAEKTPFTMTMFGEMYMGGATTASNEIAAAIRSTTDA